MLSTSPELRLCGQPVPIAIVPCRLNLLAPALQSCPIKTDRSAVRISLPAWYPRKVASFEANSSPAAYPMAVLSLPAVLSDREALPTATLYAPVLIASPAKRPIPTLLEPVVMFSNPLSPNAQLLLPVVVVTHLWVKHARLVKVMAQ